MDRREGWGSMDYRKRFYVGTCTYDHTNVCILLP